MYSGRHKNNQIFKYTVKKQTGPITRQQIFDGQGLLKKRSKRKEDEIIIEYYKIKKKRKNKSVPVR